jgi:hypothetical protein
MTICVSVLSLCEGGRDATGALQVGTTQIPNLNAARVKTLRKRTSATIREREREDEDVSSVVATGSYAAKDMCAARLQVSALAGKGARDLTNFSRNDLLLPAFLLFILETPELRASKSGSRVSSFSFSLLDFLSSPLKQWMLLHFLYSLTLLDLRPRLPVGIAWLPPRYTSSTLLHRRQSSR